MSVSDDGLSFESPKTVAVERVSLFPFVVTSKTSK